MRTEINSRAGKITLVGSMIVTAVFVSLVAMFLPAVNRPRHGHSGISCPRHGHSGISCVNNQKQLGIAFRGFGIDIGNFPMQLPATNAPTTQPTTPL
jgi:hypothetical protein